MPAILFGSISTIADTSELQRASFNRAFTEHGLNWTWDQSHYRDLLSSNGGQGRIADYARSQGQDVDAQAVHQTKSRIFQETLAETDITPREGVLDTIRDAKSKGWRVGLVTTTSPENVAALLTALNPELQAGDFDVIVDSTSVDHPKPSDAAYTYALAQLHESADHCVAVEDNVGGVQAAVAAGLPCVAFPNTNTAAHDFGSAARTVDRLDAGELQQLTNAG